MGFELVVGWTPEEPAPIALCDNPACADPIMPAAGWAIAALGPPDPTRAGPPPAVRTYLVCSDPCLAALRAAVGGAWTAPLPYGTYWRAISPRLATEPCDGLPTPLVPVNPTGRSLGSTPLAVGYRRADWLAVASAAEQRGDESLGAFVRAGLAFAPRPSDPAPDRAVTLTLTLTGEQADAVRALADALALRPADEAPSIDEETRAAVAAADAIVRAHRCHPHP